MRTGFAKALPTCRRCVWARRYISICGCRTSAFRNTCAYTDDPDALQPARVVKFGAGVDGIRSGAGHGVTSISPLPLAILSPGILPVNRLEDGT